MWLGRLGRECFVGARLCGVWQVGYGLVRSGMFWLGRVRCGRSGVVLYGYVRFGRDWYGRLGQVRPVRVRFVLVRYVMARQVRLVTEW